MSEVHGRADYLGRGQRKSAAVLQPSMVRQRSDVCAVLQEPERRLGAHRRQQESWRHRPWHCR